ncbi:MAG: hypothetical protein ABFS34_08230 [Gemmatimonadota bacterium]
MNAKTVVLLGVMAPLGCVEAAPAGGGQEQDSPAVIAGPLVVDGFRGPEGALHDAAADVYLISNIDGEPAGHDDNGFISRIEPSGELESLRWIDGAAAGVELHAPKGMALAGDTLFVTDIDVVRLFDRVSGAPLGAWPVPGAEFLNDAAVGEDGSLYVTDTLGGTVQRLSAEGAELITSDEALAGPNGIAALPDGRLLVVGFFGAATNSLDPRTGTVEPQAGPTTPRTDGVALLPDGSYLVSNWEAAAVLRMAPGALEADTVVGGVESAADIAWDAARRRVIIPLLQHDRVEIHTLP